MKSSDFMKKKEVAIPLAEARKLRMAAQMEKVSAIKEPVKEPNRHPNGDIKYRFLCCRKFKSKTHVKLIETGEIIEKEVWRKNQYKRNADRKRAEGKCQQCSVMLSEKEKEDGYKTCLQCRRSIYAVRREHWLKIACIFPLDIGNKVHDESQKEGISRPQWIIKQITELLNGKEKANKG